MPESMSPNNLSRGSSAVSFSTTAYSGRRSSVASNTSEASATRPFSASSAASWAPSRAKSTSRPTSGKWHVQVESRDQRQKTHGGVSAPIPPLSLPHVLQLPAQLEAGTRGCGDGGGGRDVDVRGAQGSAKVNTIFNSSSTADLDSRAKAQDSGSSHIHSEEALQDKVGGRRQRGPDGQVAAEDGDVQHRKSVREGMRLERDRQRKEQRAAALRRRNEIDFLWLQKKTASRLSCAAPVEALCRQLEGAHIVDGHDERDARSDVHDAGEWMGEMLPLLYHDLSAYERGRISKMLSAPHLQVEHTQEQEADMAARALFAAFAHTM